VQKNSRVRLFWLVLLGALFIGTFLNPILLLACKLFVDSVSYGYTGGKTHLLLLFLLTLVALSPFRSPWNPQWNGRCLWALGLLHVWAVANQWIYSRTFGASFWQRTVLVGNGTDTSTSLFHIHAAKVPMAFVTGGAGQGFDAGGSFLGVFPWWWMALHCALLLTLALVSFLLVHERQKTWGWGKTFALALSLFIVTKNGVDGGPFSISTLVALPFLGGLLFQRRGLWVGCLLAALGCLPGAVEGGWMFLAKRPLAAGPTIAALALPLLGDRLADARSRSERIGSLLGVLLSLAILVGVPCWQYASNPFFRGPEHTLGALRFGLTEVRSGQTVNAFSRSDLTGQAPDLVQVLSHVSAGRLSFYRLKVLRNTTLMELSRRLDLSLFRAAVNVHTEPVYVEIAGPFSLPSPDQWLTSPAVLAYSFHTSPGGSRLVLKMVPGARTDVAVALLPNVHLVCRELRQLRQRPAVEAPWQPGPGATAGAF
jgi:hypothetical protein